MGRGLRRRLRQLRRQGLQPRRPLCAVEAIRWVIWLSGHLVILGVQGACPLPAKEKKSESVVRDRGRGRDRGRVDRACYGDFVMFCNRMPGTCGRDARAPRMGDHPVAPTMDHRPEIPGRDRGRDRDRDRDRGRGRDRDRVDRAYHAGFVLFCRGKLRLPSMSETVAVGRDRVDRAYHAGFVLFCRGKPVCLPSVTETVCRGRGRDRGRDRDRVWIVLVMEIL